jgi:hypothetical protein
VIMEFGVSSLLECRAELREGGFIDYGVVGTIYGMSLAVGLRVGDDL